MDSDRELLELAAKAAGIELVGFEESGTHFAALVAPSGYVRWNPLSDDGDAFRLMVKLWMDFTISGRASAVTQIHGMRPHAAYCNGDSNAASRRAIVRAAAELGREMP